MKLITSIFSLLCVGYIPSFITAAKPNIVFFFTDDQDVEMGSLNYMPKLNQYLAENGIKFQNMYASTPVCCPSRSALFS